MHPSRKQRLFFIFLVMKMAKYRKIRYRGRFRPFCHCRDGQYRLQNNTNLLAGQSERPSKCRFFHPMALIFLKPPHFHQYPHYINVIEIAMIIMMVLQLLNIVTCGRCNWGGDSTGYKNGNFEAYALMQCGRSAGKRKLTFRNFELFSILKKVAETRISKTSGKPFHYNRSVFNILGPNIPNIGILG